ncbi:MAG: hypothetical protein U0Q55_18550 [Vicinamibacterales bacterium]
MKVFLATVGACVIAVTAQAEPLNCDMSGYKAVPGLSAAVSGETLTLLWDSERAEQVRLQLGITRGTPTIRELAVRARAGQWAVLGRDLAPEYRVVSGLRRITNQQLVPLRELKVPLTDEVVEKYKWDAFWDAPLDLSVPAPRGPGRGGPPPGGPGAAPAGGRGANPGAPPGDAPPAGFGGNPPPAQGVASQPGLPRKADEIRRASAQFAVSSCAVKTDGARVEVTFPGVRIGSLFEGQLVYTVYKGSGLIEQEVVASTRERSLAYKYDSGLSGLAIAPTSKVLWRDTSNNWQDYSFGGAKNDVQVPLKTSNRIIVAEAAGGSIAAFPPPHRFFWSREIAINLGYSWYRKDDGGKYAIGVQQPEREDPSENPANFALYSARPGTAQRMPVYFYVSTQQGKAAIDSALAYTRQDRFKPLPGYQVMATHFHTSSVSRLLQMGGVDQKLPDLEAVKAVGINIFGPVDGGRLQGDRLQGQATYYEIARRHSDRNFLFMPNEESSAGEIGGHEDVLVPKPVFWDYNRPAGTPFIENHPKYGKVYHVGSPADMMELARLENFLIYMPHPRSKGSTGFPDAMKDTPQFNHDNYRGIGMRWGMGLDGSETRLCEIRCQTLLDDMNNWVADKPGPLKFVQAITETYENHPGDDIYSSNPVNYVKLASLPGPDDWSPVIDSMKRGDYFWSSGEVLIPTYEVRGTGTQRTIVADVEWTFPLDFVEVVWGDGTKTDRQIIKTTDLAPFGTKHFEIPFDATGKKWVRFAAWDTASNGAMVQPVRVNPR